MNKSRIFPAGGYRTGAAGFTLIELMIAMLLGVIVIGAVGSVFLAGQQTYRSNEALSDVQESSRIAFEMLTRDIRGAGENGCDSTSGRVANVLKNQASDWWANWGNVVRGYNEGQTDPGVAFGSGQGQRVAGTDSIQLIGSTALPLAIEKMPDNSANFKLAEPTSQLSKGDIIILCDPDHAAILQITNYNNDLNVVRNTGSSQSPGNCSKGLGFPTDCSSVTGNGYSFGSNARISKLSATDWYIGNNPETGGRSLYRMALVSGGSSADGDVDDVAQEMVRNVTDMQITYLDDSGGFRSADQITDWSKVLAVQVMLTVQSTDPRAGVDAKPLSRKFTTTTTLRNRVF
jgi:type IV pilus assembly protein PilW